MSRPTPLLFLGVLLLAGLYQGTDAHGAAKRARRTLGGTAVDSAARWPWLVSLHGDIPTVQIFGITWRSRSVACGGSLINKRWVLTAAHCFVHQSLGPKSQVAQYWTARMGDINRDSSLLDDIRDIFAEAFNSDTNRDWDIDGDRIIIHPNYNAADKWSNDMALMRLSRDAPATRYRVPSIQSVRLADDTLPGFPPGGALCVFKGWGCTEFGGGLSPVAHQVSLNIVADAQCRRYWNIDSQTRICAGGPNAGVCSGDSGGPLVCKRGNEWIQVGIASFTSPSGSLPAVFTRVSSGATWIGQVIDTFG